uniref:Translocation protein SEC63 homolog n=1 Tax=Saccoglossus kowalevskii TaxID=10224 RepID=A0ABM0MM94_SACKO|nr:PREDICTED: translocation protein SEC63 homolog [Saccoglossus kowalevskii]
MARAQFTYDESGGAFLYFVVSVYALILIPATYLIWPSKDKKDDPERLKRLCHCDGCEDKRSRLKYKDPRAGAKLKLRKLLIFLAWVGFIVLAYKASQVKTETVEFDPFEVLGIDRGATTAEIRRQYRQLSLKHHPDKGGDHLTFMKIAKAYEALTNEEAKKNWEDFGNPDGPQATSFGIALPAWIVEKQNSMWQVEEAMVQLIRDLSSVNEKVKEKPMCYPYALKARALVHSHLSRMALPLKTLEKDKNYILKKCPVLVNEIINVCSQLVVYAHAGRIAREPRLETVENCMKLSQMIVQGLWEIKSPLLQLPHFNEDIIRHCVTKKFPTVVDDEEGGIIAAGDIVTVTVTLKRNTLESFLDQETPDIVEEEEEPPPAESTDSPKATKNKPKVWEKRRKGKIKKKNKQVNKKQIKKKEEKKEEKQDKKKKDEKKDDRVQDVGKKDNRHDSEDGSNKHSGAEDSDSDDNRDQRHSDGSSDSENEPASNDRDGAGEDEDWDELQANITRREKVLETKSKLTHEVHCPFFPEVKQEWWWLYLADRKKHALVTTPTQICTLRDEEKSQIKFQAPPKPGTYHYQVCLKSDSYLDLDVQQSIKLEVHEARAIEDSHPQWDISDDDDNKDDSDEVDYTTDDEDSDQDD